MKKKIFLMLTLCVMLVCVFAISVSAVTIYDDFNVKSLENIKYVENDIITFDDGFSCPSVYVFKDTNSIDKSNWGQSTGLQSALDFTYINEKTSKEYTFENVVSLDIPQGVVSIGSYAGSGMTTLKKISIPDTATNLASAIFQNATGLEVCIFEHSASSTLTEFPAWMFYGSGLKAFSMPDCITTINYEAEFSECSSLTAVYLSKNLTAINISGSNATFDDCGSLYFVNEPFVVNNVETDIPAKPTVYYFPKNLASIADNCVFRGCSSLNDVLVFGEKITSVPNMWTFQNSPDNTVVFLGDMTTVNSSRWGTSTLIFANEADTSSSDLTLTLGGQSVNYCNAEGNKIHLYKVNVKEEATCTEPGIDGIKCFCGAVDTDNSITTEPKGHEKTEIFAIVYNGANKFFGKGDTTYTCGVCGEKHTVAGDRKVIFKSLGYSATERETGRYSITQGFVVDKDAMNEYNLYSENDVVGYGLVAGTVSGLGENADVFELDGEVNNQNVAVVDFMSRPQYDIFEIKVSGLEGSNESYEYSEAEIYCCGYCLVQIGDNVVSYYASEGTVTESLSMSTSYDTLKPADTTVTE